MTTIIVDWDDDDRGTQTGTWTTPSPDFVPRPTRERLDEPIDPEGDRCVLNGKPYVLYGMWDYAEDWSGEFLREVHPFMLIGAPQITAEEFRKLVLAIDAERLNAIGSVSRSGQNAGAEGGPDMHGLPTEADGDCIGTFHSSEMDDPTQYDEGFYIAAFVSPVIGCIVGPYTTEDEAVEAMNAGVWMGEQASRLERVNGAYRAKREVLEAGVGYAFPSWYYHRETWIPPLIPPPCRAASVRRCIAPSNASSNHGTARLFSGDCTASSRGGS